MAYLKKMDVSTNELQGVLYVTDDASVAKKLKQDGEAVLIYFHSGNKQEDFSEFTYGLEDPENMDSEYLEKIYRRLKRLPWSILETKRCVIRETTLEDVDDFYEIYNHPSVTKYMENLYPQRELEEEYIEEYIDKIYTFYEFGVWTIQEKESGKVIGRAGFSFRAGYEDPEIGFVIGVPWQRMGYAYEVCEAIMKYGWDELKFQTIQALVETGNEASLKLCDKLGFVAVKELIEDGKDYFLLKCYKDR